MGRFILLTYNLGALYAYSLSIHDDDHDDDEGGIDPAIVSTLLSRTAPARPYLSYLLTGSPHEQ